MRVRSPLLAQSLNCFLLLQVLRCFSSLGLLLLLGNLSSSLDQNDGSSYNLRIVLTYVLAFVKCSSVKEHPLLTYSFFSTRYLDVSVPWVGFHAVMYWLQDGR